MSCDLETTVAAERESPRLSSRVRFALAALALIIAAGAGYAWRQHLRYKRVAVHDPGRVYRAAWVDHEVMRELIERYEIRTVINLCQPGETGEHNWDLERTAVRSAGARLLELPMPASPQDPAAALQRHRQAIGNEANYPILVHCDNGIERTSQFLVLYDLAARGMTPEESLANQPTFGRDKHAATVRQFCELVEK